MRLNCPHCHNAIDLVEPDTLNAQPEAGAAHSSATTCPVCGSELPMFESTLSHQGELRPKIGQYELREQLGQGQFGVVWKAWDSELDRLVALKIPRTTEIFEKGEELFRK